MSALRELVLLRHTESRWNKDGRFTGWADIRLSEYGNDEADLVGAILEHNMVSFDVCYTSLLARPIQTLHRILEKMDLLWLPVHKTWRLNERHYGGLTGLYKAEAEEQFGKEQILRWRRGFKDRPPEITPEAQSLLRIGGLRYPPDLIIPKTESLEDTLERIRPYWREEILPALLQNKRPIIISHGNTMRAMMMGLDGLSEREVEDLEIPKGRPIRYKLIVSGEENDIQYRVVSKEYLK